LSETIDLYQILEWDWIGHIAETKKMKNDKVKVVEIIYYLGNSYVAVELNHQWFWTYKNKIAIEKGIL
jgi:hypothetical protein